ncbi:MAG TPA: serine/threonine-protein kinase [Phycisphaerales bacterium]|nr:serine/threonine-protein kinase [Phycisphaerales bacterium]
MNRDDSKPLHERVSHALDAAGDLTGTALIEHIERAHGDDLELVAEVRSLLGGEGAVPVLDDSGPVQELARKLQDRLLTSELFTRGGTPRPATDNATPPPMPARVGGYDIRGVIGQGGMGVVYEAMQDSPRRRVAIKMLSTTAPTRTALTRFRREAEMLGKLKHPGIAQVFEAATDPTSGAAFFAMEFVDGPPLTAFAQAKQLTLSQRVELLARVCDATQHAHQAGVIHRDLKPSNILVEASSDGIGNPKVLDFGVASLNREAEQTATLSLDAGRIIGTLGYMPPEAIDGSEGADTRGDIYSLGVILYELLAGRLPVDVKGASLTEAARRIREKQPDALPALANAGERTMRDDLNLIVQKALAKEAAMRYASAAEFAADLRRCLRHEPVLARPASTWYTLRKFIRRRRGASALVAASVMLVTSAAIVASVQSVRANRALASEEVQREIAERKREEAERGQYRAAIAAAVAAMRTQTPVEARKSLEEAPEEMRGWEWRYLYSTAHPGRSVKLPEAVMSLGPFARGERVLSESRVTPYRTFVWNVSDGRLLATHALRRMHASEDGRFFAGIDATGQVVCVDEAGQTLWREPPPAGTTWASVTLVQLSETEPWRVVIFGDFAMTSLDARTGERHWRTTSEFACDRGIVQRVEDAKRPVVLAMWQASPTQQQAWLDVRTGEWIPDGVKLRLSPPTINSGVGFGWTLFLRFGEEYPGRRAPADAVWTESEVSRDASTIVMGDSRGVVSLYTRNPADPYAYLDAGTLPMGSGVIRAVTFLQNDRAVATVDETGAVRIAPALTPQMPFHTTADLRTSPGPISEDGTRAASLGWGFVGVSDTLTGMPIWRRNLGRTFPGATAFSPDGTRLVWFGDRDGTWNEFFVLNAETGEQLLGYSTSPFVVDATHRSTLAPWPSSVRAVSFDPGRPRLVTGHLDGTVRVIDTGTWEMLDEPRAQVDAAAPVMHSLVHSPDGSKIAVVYTDRVERMLKARPVLVLDAVTLQTLATLSADDAAFAATWSQDGSQLVVGYAAGVVGAWEVETGKRLWRTDLGSSDIIRSVAISPDGQRIAAASIGPQVHLLEHQGRVVATFPSPVAEVRSLHFTRDDELLATAIRAHVLRFAVDDRERDTWTPQAIAAWPANVPRPESLVEARRIVQQADALVTDTLSELRPMHVRMKMVQDARSVDERTRALAEAWLTRLGPIVTWGNSDALVLMRDRPQDRQALEYARDILLELIPLKPHVFNLRSNLAEVYYRLGERGQAIEMMTSAEVRLAASEPEFDAAPYASILEFYVKVRDVENAQRVMVAIDEHLASGDVRGAGATVRKQIEDARTALQAIIAEQASPR